MRPMREVNSQGGAMQKGPPPRAEFLALRGAGPSLSELWAFSLIVLIFSPRYGAAGASLLRHQICLPRVFVSPCGSARKLGSPNKHLKSSGSLVGTAGGGSSCARARSKWKVQTLQFYQTRLPLKSPRIVRRGHSSVPVLLRPRNAHRQRPGREERQNRNRNGGVPAPGTTGLHRSRGVPRGPGEIPEPRCICQGAHRPHE